VAAHEWADDGIRVDPVSPIAHTAGVDTWARTHVEPYERMLTNMPLGRMGDPEHDLAPAVLLLASDDSRYMTGQTLMADGGTTMLR